MSSKYFLIIICSLIVSKTLSGQQSSLSKEAEKKVDSLFAAYLKAGSPGHAIGIFKDRKVLLAKGYGMANLDYNIPITAGCQFRYSTCNQWAALQYQ